MIPFAADRRAVELLAVEQHDHRVLELHSRHFARERHIADREFVFAVGREVVLDDEAATRTERHALEVMLLAARARSPLRRQRDDHVRGVAVLRRERRSLKIADRLLRDRTRRADVLGDERRRNLERVGVVVEAAFDVVLGQQNGRVDIESEQVTNGVRVLTSVQPMQRNAARLVLACLGVDAILEPGHQLRGGFDVWTRLAGRRHETAAQFTNGGFPCLGIVGDAVGRQLVECAPAGLLGAVVTVEAVVLDDAPFRRVAFMNRTGFQSDDGTHRRDGDHGQRVKRKSKAAFDGCTPQMDAPSRARKSGRASWKTSPFGHEA